MSEACHSSITFNQFWPWYCLSVFVSTFIFRYSSLPRLNRPISCSSLWLSCGKPCHFYVVFLLHKHRPRWEKKENKKKRYTTSATSQTWAVTIRLIAFTTCSKVPKAELNDGLFVRRPFRKPLRWKNEHSSLCPIFSPVFARPYWYYWNTLLFLQLLALCTIDLQSDDASQRTSRCRRIGKKEAVRDQPNLQTHG